MNVVVRPDWVYVGGLLDLDDKYPSVSATTYPMH